MLHILFFILKIAGMILAIILGILVLCLGILLFVPISYKGHAAASGAMKDISACGQVSWLFGLIRIVASVKDQVPEVYVKIAWFRLGDRRKPAGKKREETIYEEEEEDSGDKTDPIYKKVEEQAEIPEKREEYAQKPEEIHEEKPRLSEEVKEEAGRDRLQDIFLKIKRKIKGIAEKIKCTIAGFCDKIKAASGKKDQLTAFLSDEIHLRAFKKAKQEGFRFLRRISPKVVRGSIRYGFEDPDLTGKVLAGLSMLYPFVGEHAKITPDFQKQVLEGEIRIRGRLFIVHLAALALSMVLCKDVRKTVRDVRQFRL